MYVDRSRGFFAWEDVVVHWPLPFLNDSQDRVLDEDDDDDDGML
jgi:hypothetical protein